MEHVGWRGGAYMDYGGETRKKEITWKTRTRMKDNIKMDVQEVGCECMDCIDLAQGI
jgi:hypothetical protein